MTVSVMGKGNRRARDPGQGAMLGPRSISFPHVTFCDMEYKNTSADGGLDLVISHFHLKSKLKEIIKMIHVSVTGWRYPFL